MMQTAAVPSEECSGESTQHGEHGRVDAANRERASLQMSGGGQSRGLQRTGARVRARVPVAEHAAEHAATHACNTPATVERRYGERRCVHADALLQYERRTQQNATSKRGLWRLPHAKRAFCSIGCSQQRIPLAPSATGTRAACLLATLSWLAS